MSQSRENEVWEQLMYLKIQTETLGVLHEAQVLQLKMWPLVMIGNAEKSEVHVSVEKREIDFIVKTKGRLADAQTWYKRLDESVKTLLGDTWLIRIKNQTKTLYRGPRKKAFKPKKVDTNGLFSNED